jgi:hypothetical protein
MSGGRNDAILNTGMSLSSQRLREQRAARAEAHKQAMDVSAKFRPAAELVLDLIRKELVFCKQPANIDVQKYTIDQYADWKADMLALQRYEAYLHRLQAEVTNVMRNQPKPTEPSL